MDYWSFPLDDTEQARRVDIAFTKDVAIVNLHAESMAEAEDTRLLQFSQVERELRKGMARYGIKAGILCGDLNCRTNSKASLTTLSHHTLPAENLLGDTGGLLHLPLLSSKERRSHPAVTPPCWI